MTRVAIIHDWLVTWAGAEKALAEILCLYPQADIYTLVNFLSAADAKHLKNHKIHTSIIQKLPLAKRHYRTYLPLMPLAVEQFDLSEYDLVISSSHAVAKGVITGPETQHICYCYTPMRYAWDLQHEYLKETRPNIIKSLIQRWLLHRLRQWDLAASHRVDEYLAISKHIARRIQKHYRRKATVIYPPVDTEHLTQQPLQPKQDFYLAASRLVPYKRIQLIAEAFAQMPDKQLLIIGSGPEQKNLQQHLKRQQQQGQTNVSYLGYQTDQQLHQYLATAKAYIFCAEEDFGILPVEAQALGTPVIALGKGGALETIKANETGLFFKEASTTAIQAALHSFESQNWSALACREHSQKFSKQQFLNALKKHIKNLEQQQDML